MKKAKRSELVFDLEYVQDIAPEKAQARRVADMWRFYLECRPVTNQLRETLLRDIETEIEQAIKSGDAGFFRRFANYIEKPKEPCRIRTWLLDVHINNINGPDTRFTHAELIQGVKAAGFFKGMEDDSILTALKRMMKGLNLPFKNSPKYKGEHL
jgi:hypothetical protein